MTEVKKWTITFTNGYCGCDQEEEFEGTFEEAIAWATESLQDYAEQYTHVAFGWGEEFSDEEFEDYFANCDYKIVESEEDED